jgi:hypothetical protein
MTPRSRYEMPGFFRDAPNTRTKLESTRQKRLNQMLDELEHGRVYMKMKWNG